MHHKIVVHKGSEVEGERQGKNRNIEDNYMFHSGNFISAWSCELCFKFVLQSSLLTCNKGYIFSHMKVHRVNEDVLLSTASLHRCREKSHRLQPSEKGCRFPKWRMSAWATVSWNSTAVRRRVSRTENWKQLIEEDRQTETCIAVEKWPEQKMTNNSHLSSQS